ncbi:BTAD domain-containing putative transcriptional regulator [Streptomyces sp. NPDC007076]|uniref:AfsR/SARP family transcriptional regulator n=1 Tax=unclassified Streptomyces TaxID=2593676 RepID=UPI002E75AE98|nr:BTAD domain-containing putative transcriptional regulator [Streptomyces sp. JV190]MEE1843363.1 BTAD domain-containing putative transcriptional regulator [Streptomyces sp. JV190]
MTRLPTRAPSSGALNLSVLGPLSGQLDGRPLLLGPRKQRLVLAMLLSRPNTPVPVDVLTDAVWPDAPPRTARKNLQVYISSARTLLGARCPDGPDGGGGGERLAHSCGGYLLRVGEDELDSLRFRSLAAAGRRAADDGDQRAAADLLRRALDLWQGPPLHDLRDSPEVAAEAERLEARCLTVHEDWAETEIALGRAPAVVDGLRDLAERHPSRERIRAAWMDALHRTGRRAEALAVYDDYRQLLARELGLEPGAAIAARHRAMLTGRDTADRPRDAAPARRTPALRAVLPAEVPDFTGRGEQLRELLDVLGGEGGRVVAVTGAAGTGKTALAVRAAHLLADRFPDGRIHIRVRDEQGAVRPTAAVVGELARLTGGPHPAEPMTDAEHWRHWLAAHRALVVLDDVPDEAAVRALLPGTGGSSFVLTARGQLAGLAPVHRIALPPLAPAEALALLGRLAGPGRVGLDRSAALRIAEACGLLPLAVRVSGMRLAVLRHLPLAEYADRLADPAGALDELVAGDISVRARLASGWQDLSPGSGQALALLAAAVGEGPFTLPEAMAALGCGERQALRAVESLIDAGAVSSPSGEVTAHCVLYELPRLTGLYARERDTAPEPDSIPEPVPEPVGAHRL